MAAQAWTVGGAGMRAAATSGSFFCNLALFQNNFYNWTPRETISKNRPFLGVLIQYAVVCGSASYEATPRWCHVIDDHDRRKHMAGARREMT